MVIGLTGMSCSGKDRVAELLKSECIVVIDEDKLGHEALSAKKDELTDTFGPDIISEDGTVNRKKLGSIVFSSPEKLEALNRITHPWMVERTLSECKAIEDEGKVAVINAAILESMGFVEHCDLIILVYAPYNIRLERAIKRDSISEEGFRRRSDAQKDIGLKALSSGKRVITIINDGSDEQLSRQVSLCCANILK